VRFSAFMRCVFAVFTLAIVYMDKRELSNDGFVKIARIGAVTTLDRQITVRNVSPLQLNAFFKLILNYNDNMELQYLCRAMKTLFKVVQNLLETKLSSKTSFEFTASHSRPSLMYAGMYRRLHF
jgi:hypothetical protein